MSRWTAVAARRSRPRTTSVTPCCSVVNDYRQMVARRQIAAAQDDVAPDRGLSHTLRGDGALAEFAPDKRLRRGGERAPHVEAEGRPFAAREARAPFGGLKRAAGPGVERRAVGVAPALRGARDVGPAAKAGIDKPFVVEPYERRRVIVAMLALAARRRFEAKTEPCEIVDDRGLVLRLATRAVQVFNAQQQAPLRLGGEALV